MNHVIYWDYISPTRINSSTILKFIFNALTINLAHTSVKGCLLSELCLSTRGYSVLYDVLDILRSQLDPCFSLDEVPPRSVTQASTISPGSSGHLSHLRLRLDSLFLGSCFLFSPFDRAHPPASHKSREATFMDSLVEGTSNLSLLMVSITF